MRRSSNKAKKLSTHSIDRFRQRTDLSKSRDMKRLFTNALKRGNNPDHYHGAFEQYLASHKRKSTHGVKVYANLVFIYNKRSRTLVTVFKVPDEYVPLQDYEKGGKYYESLQGNKELHTQ